MGRLKRKSKAIEKAEKRIAGIKAIDPALDLGSGLSVDSYQSKIEGTEDVLEIYNTSLSVADAKLNDLQKEEKELNDLSELILEAVAVKYGHDSNEYEMAGGTRKSERKRPSGSSDVEGE